MKIEVIKEKQDDQELLPQIVERIFLICRNDPNFKLKDEMETVEINIKSIQDKIGKQYNLLEQACEKEADIGHRIQSLIEQNERKRLELLENIGGEE
jgi:hypothetical protein